MSARWQRPGAAVAVLAGIGLALLVVPLLALLLRAPWGEVGRLTGDPAAASALRLSLTTAAAATSLAVVTGVPLAWLLARRRFPGRALVRALVVVPMVLPPVVAGVALLLAFGRRGIVGGPLAAATGITVPFTSVAVVLAGAFVAMPFLVIVTGAGFAAADRRYEEVAATLGASRRSIALRVTLPQIVPALAAGIALAFARALGEFGATITFAGNLPGRTQTVPLAVYLLLETDPAAATLLSILLMAVSVTVLIALRGRLVGRP